MSDVIIPSSEKELDTFLASDGTPLLVDFSATWCGPCKSMMPALEAFATERKSALRVVKVDIDEFQTHAAKVGIRSVPTLLVVKNGAVLGVKSGALTKQGLADFVDRNLD